ECAWALGRIRDEAAPVLEQLAARHELPPAAVPELRRVYRDLEPIGSWNLLGPLAIDAKLPVSPAGPIDLGAQYTGQKGDPIGWKAVKVIDRDGQIRLNTLYSDREGLAVLGYAELPSDEDRTATMTVASDDTLTVWLNGEQVYDFSDSRSFEPGR